MAVMFRFGVGVRIRFWNAGASNPLVETQESNRRNDPESASEFGDSRLRAQTSDQLPSLADRWQLEVDFGRNAACRRLVRLSWQCRLGDDSKVSVRVRRSESA
mmetsp:Transcript_19042/g.45769  ORF Transcript_19042/g.45769 Transcript_19042/m.45769 type:complete len:103 (-) Transcript_19042:132-440(-)